MEVLFDRVTERWEQGRPERFVTIETLQDLIKIMDEEGEGIILEWDILDYRTGKRRLKLTVYDDYNE